MKVVARQGNKQVQVHYKEIFSQGIQVRCKALRVQWRIPAGLLIIMASLGTALEVHAKNVNLPTHGVPNLHFDLKPPKPVDPMLGTPFYTIPAFPFPLTSLRSRKPPEPCDTSGDRSAVCKFDDNVTHSGFLHWETEVTSLANTKSNDIPVSFILERGNGPREEIQGIMTCIESKETATFHFHVVDGLQEKTSWEWFVKSTLEFPIGVDTSVTEAGAGGGGTLGSRLRFVSATFDRSSCTFTQVPIGSGSSLLFSLREVPQSSSGIVANTSQKGSLLMFPDIDVREGRATSIQITNDADRDVNVKCYYINQSKGRADFQFTLTKKQTVSWDVASGAGEPIHMAPFPNSQPIPFGDPLVGELICFAVNGAGSRQVFFNHLSGVASVYDATTGTTYGYNSWNFRARPSAGDGSPPDLGAPHGSAGHLQLTGANDGESYDACPAYNIVHFAPPGSARATGIGIVSNVNTKIAVSTCAQDLRQDFTPHWTKLQIPVWNAHKVTFTGAFECTNSTHHFLLSEIDVLPGTTSFAVLRTEAAHLQLQGVESNQCGPFLPSGAETEDVGLVAVASSLVNLPDGTPTVAGTNSTTAGVHPVPGFVLWDPADDIVPAVR